MTQDDVRRLREALFVLQEQLLRNLLFDALKREGQDRLNFFRVYRGALMDGIVTDWWKIFGNRSEPSHWRSLIPPHQHEDIVCEISIALANLDPSVRYQQVWNCAKRYRNTSVAHLDYNEASRARVYPRLAPLRVSAEIIYRRVFDLLGAEGLQTGFPTPDAMMGDVREKELAHYTRMCSTAREALAHFENSYLV